MGVTLRRLPARVAEALSAVCAAPLEAGHQGRARRRQGPWREAWRPRS